MIRMTNSKATMTNQDQNSNARRVYDLEDRTAQFGETIIDFVKTLPGNRINNTLVGQVVRSGTSIGANYMEADGAESKKDFRHKIAICRKESKETKHWLRMIARANPNKKEASRKLSNEAQELTLIFSSISVVQQKTKVDGTGEGKPRVWR